MTSNIKYGLATLVGIGVGAAAVGLWLNRKESGIKSLEAEINALRGELAAQGRNTDASGATQSPSSPSSPSSPGTSLSSSLIKPPLPPTVVNLLRASQLCFLSTSYGNDPHLSLMNFTYYQEDEVVIMATKRDTKKFRQILQSNTVALLIHDFPHLKLDKNSMPTSPKNNSETTCNKNEPGNVPNSGCTYSITLNGVAEIAKGEYSEKLRRIHLAANPSYADFIQRNDRISSTENPDPAIVVVRIESARICNFKDQVRHWNKNGVSQSLREDAK